MCRSRSGTTSLTWSRPRGHPRSCGSAPRPGGRRISWGPAGGTRRWTAVISLSLTTCSRWLSRSSRTGCCRARRRWLAARCPTGSCQRSCSGCRCRAARGPPDADGDWGRRLRVLGSWLSGLTTRGTSFLAAGVAATLAGIALPEKSRLCVGVALIGLPVFSLIAARRARYRLSCSRLISPPRVPAGSTAHVTLRLHNISKMPTGLLLAEDAIPYALGPRPRYVLDNIERRGIRNLSYSLRSDLRGRFEIGPLQLRVADSFGLVEITRSLSGRTTFIVTPRVVALARTVISRSWAGEGEGRARLAAMAGEDDVIPREYRDGDELRRVHWKSTARYGELMVRREEQQWRNHAVLLLDTRRSAHAGTGAGSSFETAISAAASVGVHVAQEGLTGQFITDTDVLRSGPFF